MSWIRRQDIVYLVLAVLFAGVGPFWERFLKDPDVGVVISVFGVFLVILQFMYVYEVRNNTSFVSDYLAINDKSIKWIVDRKLEELKRLAKDANRGRVELSLDDLFQAVTYLVENCETLDCVDIRTERWSTDRRAIRYLDACKRAVAERGATICRIFIFSKEMRAEVEKFVASNEETEVIRQVKKLLRDQRDARIGIAILFHDEVRQGYFRDFGIFDKVKVLDEAFDAAGHSRYQGFVSTDSDEVREYRQIHNELKKIAEGNQRLIDALLD
jgi:hypothetical protein